MTTSKEFVIVRNSMVKSLYDVLEVDYESENFSYVAKAQSFEDASERVLRSRPSQNIFDLCASAE